MKSIYFFYNNKQASSFTRFSFRFRLYGYGYQYITINNFIKSLK